eukprot:Opistho-1_new@76882
MSWDSSSTLARAPKRYSYCPPALSAAPSEILTLSMYCWRSNSFSALSGSPTPPSRPFCRPSLLSTSHSFCSGSAFFDMRIIMRTTVSKPVRGSSASDATRSASSPILSVRSRKYAFACAVLEGACDAAPSPSPSTRCVAAAVSAAAFPGTGSSRAPNVSSRRFCIASIIAPVARPCSRITLLLRSARLIDVWRDSVKSANRMASLILCSTSSAVIFSSARCAAGTRPCDACVALASPSASSSSSSTRCRLALPLPLSACEAAPRPFCDAFPRRCVAGASSPLTSSASSSSSFRRPRLGGIFSPSLSVFFSPHVLCVD